jgi:signal transduction histidine kinase
VSEENVASERQEDGRHNENALLGSTLSLLDTLVLEHLHDGVFRILGGSPGSFDRILEIGSDSNGPVVLHGKLSFLDHFLAEAEDFWASNQGLEINSGVWQETTGEGKIENLEAQALKIEGHHVLILRNLARSYSKRQQVYQTARENQLKYQRLIREIQDKEILLHCILHDLSGPLMGIKSCLSWLAKEELSESGKRRLGIGRKAADKLERLMREVLEVFSAENESDQLLAEGYPDVISCASSVVETLQPAASLKGVELEMAVGGKEDLAWRALAEETRLERVFYNLIENAIRHSPQGGTVRLNVSFSNDQISVAIDDDGPGVPEKDQAGLFEKFFQGNRSGKAGLGLYFCRIVVERWGGQIGYAERSPQGSRFWFRLLHRREE